VVLVLKGFVVSLQLFFMTIVLWVVKQLRVILIRQVVLLGLMLLLIVVKLVDVAVSLLDLQHISVQQMLWVLEIAT
jgi:hypothetical protein